MGCYNTAVVTAPVDRVWAALRDFHDMSWASGVITELSAEGDAKADQPGAKRLLNGMIHETLLALDDHGREFKYSIDDGPEAVSKENVSGYVGHVRVFPVTASGDTFVEWSSSWTGGGAGTKEFCDPIYHALLDALSKHFA